MACHLAATPVAVSAPTRRRDAREAGCCLPALSGRVDVKRRAPAAHHPTVDAPTQETPTATPTPTTPPRRTDEAPQTPQTTPTPGQGNIRRVCSTPPGRCSGNGSSSTAAQGCRRWRTGCCLRRLESTDPEIIELREWSRLDEDLTRERVRLANRMRQQRVDAARSAASTSHQARPGHGRGRRCTFAAPHRTPRPGQPPTRSRAPRARAVGTSARRYCSCGRRQRVPGGRVIVEGAPGCGHPAVAARRWHQGALDTACRGKRRGGAAGLRRASLSLRGGSGHPPFGEEHDRDAAPGSPQPAARRRLPLGPGRRPTRSGQPRQVPVAPSPRSWPRPRSALGSRPPAERRLRDAP